MISFFVIVYMLSCSSYCIGLTKSCEISEFSCENGRCVPKSLECNDHNDCGDFSDEIFCDIIKIATEEEESVNCTDHDFSCHSGQQCIPSTWICDKQRDCLDGSDEYANCHFENCTGFPCRTSKECIPSRWRCDGSHDCIDNSDEVGCFSAESRCKKEDGRFQCNDGLCLPSSSVCNNVTDCLEGEDEGGLCGSVSNNCKNKKCNHKCMDTPSGPQCYCMLGYQSKDNGLTCKDVNECERFRGVCGQGCTNTKGSYFCYCDQGFQLMQDKTSCHVVTGIEPQILISSPRSVDLLNLRSGSVEQLMTSSNTIEGIAFDGPITDVFWFEGNEVANFIKSKKIGSGYVDKTIMQKGLHAIEDVDIDWLNQKLYITDSSNEQIVACSLDGSNCVVVVKPVKSSSLFLCPKQGRMFWSSYGDNKGITQANMDGSQQKLILSTNSSWPHGLFFDEYSNTLFWADVKQKVIHSYDIILGKSQVLVDQQGYHPYSTAVFEENLYWSDLNFDAVLYCNKFTGRHIKTVHKGILRPLNLVINHPILYTHNGLNPCLKSSCSHSCLLSSNGSFSCKCPVKMQLERDGRTCRSTNESNTLLIMHSSKSMLKLYQQPIGHDIFEEIPIHLYGHNIGAIQYDLKSNCFFYSDLELDAIFSFNLTDNDKRKIIHAHIDTVKGLAIDSIGNNIYWTDTALGTLQVARLDGSFIRVIYDYLERPTEIVLGTDQGIGFILQQSTPPKILQFRLTGNYSPVEVVSSELDNPRSLTWDPKSSLLLWVDSVKFTMEVYDYKTTVRRRFLQHIPKPISMCMGKEYVYWMNLNGRVMSVSVGLGVVNVESAFLFQQDQNLTPKLLSSNIQQTAKVRNCFNDGKPICQQLCLQGLDSYNCSCSFGFELNADLKTCSEKKCNEQEFKCAKSEICIPKSYRCDANDDCKEFDPDDASDEENCFKCVDNEFMCTSTGRCIHHSWKCDGVPDCADGADERSDICNKNAESCEGKFSCGQGQCVDNAWVCDNEIDCTNEADERNCKIQKCLPDVEFECAPGVCIPNNWVCDGFRDCENHFDEASCTTVVEISCLSDEFTCKNGHCVDSSLACDGDQDCPDGSDEDQVLCGFNETKQFECSAEEWKCPNSDKCLNLNQTCDGINDCSFGEDETHCPSANSASTECQLDHWKCYESDKCILNLQKCDGIPHCADGEDERNCPIDQFIVPPPTCLHDREFMCDYDSCIPFRWVCDGENDCKDNTDENPLLCFKNETSTTSTTESPCEFGQFQCISGECLEAHALCDGHPDCEDYSDEGSKCNMCSRNNGGCSHICTSSFHGPVCSCPRGMKLHHGLICEDINECKEWGKCSQLCFNTRGNFKCSCRPNFVLEPDGRRCRPVDNTGLNLLTSFKGQIRSISSDGFHLHVIAEENNTLITDFAYDERRRILLFISSTNGNIRYISSNENGSASEIPLFSPATTLALDWITGNIYYSSVDQTIGVCNFQSQVNPMCMNMFSGLTDHVASLAVAAHKAMMFWSTWGTGNQKNTNGAIWHALLDGSEKRMIVKSKLANPQSLTVDVATKRIFWCDTSLNMIETSNFNGQDRFVILRGLDLGNPLSIGIFGDTVYWMSKTFGLLMAANKFDKGNSYSVARLGNNYRMLKISHPYMQPKGINPCTWNSSSCSHICLINKGSSTCFCPHGYVKISSNQCLSPTYGIKNDTIITNENKTRLHANRCPEGYSGERCEISGSGSSYSAVNIGLGLGISFSVVLVAFLTYNNRHRIKDYIMKKHAKNVTITFSNNNNNDGYSDTLVPLNNLPKANNRKIAAAQLAENKSSKGLLSFNNPLSENNYEENTPEITWQHGGSNLYSGDLCTSDEHLHVFETDDHANLISNVQFHISPSSESLTM